MTRKKRRTEEKIHQDIMDFMEKIDFPRTTEEIARSVGLNWYAATTHLTKLKMEGKVFHKKVGKQNQWWPENVKGQKDKIRELEGENTELKKRIAKLEQEIKKLK